MDKQRLNEILRRLVVECYFVSEEDQSSLGTDELVAAARAMGIDPILDKNASVVDFVVHVAQRKAA